MDNDRSDEQLLQDHIHDFIKNGRRESGNELLGAAAGFARGGLVGGLAGAFLTPIASAAGHAVAKAAGLEKDDED